VEFLKSKFYAIFVKTIIFSRSSSNSDNMKMVHRAFIKSPIGFLELVGSEKGLQEVHFLDFKVKIQKRFPGCLKEAADQLDAYFSNSLTKFTVRVDLTGTSFQHRVWRELMKVPFGSTTTYLEIAKKLGNEHTLRAVGGANASNPIPIIVPCHRVIGRNGKLVGYAGGLRRKKWLLEHEHAFSQGDLFYSPK
jgi:methylated-DNA-[protein]-cysteine S-methyltransferase